MVKIWQIAMATLLIYAAGVVTGGLLVKVSAPTPDIQARQTQPRPPEHKPSHDRHGAFVSHMAQELALSDEQRDGISRILKESGDRMRVAMEPIGRAEFERTRDEINALLSPEQQAKAAEFIKKRNFFRTPSGDKSRKDGKESKDQDKQKLEEKAASEGKQAACNRCVPSLIDQLRAGVQASL